MSTGYQSGVGGAGGGYDFKPGPTQNEFGSDTSTAEQAATARDNYGSSNPDWLATYDANQNLFIELTFLNTMQNATQKVALVAQRRKNGLWQSVTHNDNTNSPLPPTAGNVAKILTAIDETGGMGWANPPLFSVASSSTLNAATPTPCNALNVIPNSYCEIVDNGNGYTVLTVDGDQLENDLNKSLSLNGGETYYDAGNKLISNLSDGVSDQDAVTLIQMGQRTINVIYDNLSDLRAKTGEDVTLLPLGSGGMTDDEVRAQNLLTVSAAMDDYSVFYYAESTDPLLCPVNYSSIIITRTVSSRLTGLGYTSVNSQLYTWSGSSDTASEWRTVLNVDSLSTYGIAYDSDNSYYPVTGALHLSDGIQAQFSNASIASYTDTNLIYKAVSHRFKDLSGGEFGTFNSAGFNLKANGLTNSTINSDSGLELALTSGTLSAKIGSTQLFYADSVAFYLYGIPISGVAAQPATDDAVVINSQLTDYATTASVEQDFSNAVIPRGGIDSFIHDKNLSDDEGYTHNNIISYYPPAASSSIQYPSSSAGNVTFVHYKTADRLGMMLFKQSSINDIFGINSDNLPTISISLQNLKTVLGKANQNSFGEAYVWNLEARAVKKGTDINNVTANSQYCDANGDTVASRADALNAGYSSGLSVQNGLVILERGGFIYNSATLTTEFKQDNSSDYFVLRDVTAGGSTFNVIKIFEVFQYSFAQVSDTKVTYYDSASDILGAQGKATIEAVTDLDERVTALDGNTVPSNNTVGIAQDSDSNGVIESILMPESIHTEFDLNVSATETKKIGYNSELTNSILFDVIISAKNSNNRCVIVGMLEKQGASYEVGLSSRKGFNFGISVDKNIIDDQLHVVLSGASEEVSIKVVARVQS